jgi:hypothetical protein
LAPVVFKNIAALDPGWFIAHCDPETVTVVTISCELNKI